MTNRALAILIIRRLRAKGHEALLAGGCVRDRLLRRRPKDYDVATSARPEEVRKLFRRTLAIGEQFGVIVVLDKAARVEVATFRSDATYADGRHPTAVRFTSAREDAARRDFTINAMFYDPISRRTIDYVGGQKDLERGLIRAVGDPEARFREDHLRMLRAVRFAARLRTSGCHTLKARRSRDQSVCFSSDTKTHTLASAAPPLQSVAPGFRLAPATAKAIRKLAPLIKKVSGERIRAELELMLTAPSRVEALKLADSLGLLKQILPELSATKGCRQGRTVHPEGDVWQHTLRTVSVLRRPSFTVALAALLHDVGKPPTADYYNNNVHIYAHPKVGSELAAKIAARLRPSAAEKDEIAWAVRHHLDLLQIRQMRTATVKRIFQHPFFPTLAQVIRADMLGSCVPLAEYHAIMRLYRRLRAEDLRPAPLVRGHDILRLGLAPGPAIGRILRQLYDEQLDGDLVERKDALRRAKKLVAAEIKG
jgi:tRNA nucleotidyltransferase/poly(A) polymerase